MSAAVAFAGDQMSVRFDSFDLASYDLFLKVKRLPESRVEFHGEGETYTVSAPARFAALLGVVDERPPTVSLPYAPHLLDDQEAITDIALEAKRFAVWSDCGLGKTAIELEWSRHVVHRTNGRVLITTMADIIDQTVDEARKFYGTALPMERLESRNAMREWARDGAPGIGITNYEKWNPESLDAQVMPEIRHLAGVALDESSRLKTGGGKQKWAIIKSTKGVEYKLSLTATPAPNDVMEFASQASFLEQMRSESEILWTYFTRDQKTHRWTVRPHARAAFFEFMSSWSIFMRDPRKYGWRMGMPEVPKPQTVVHEIAPTPEQKEWLTRLSADATGQLSLFDRLDTNAIQRAKLSQVAKGFIYRHKVTKRGVERRQYDKGRGGRLVERIPSLKPGFVADLVRRDASEGLQVLVWTVFDAEAEILAEELRMVHVCARCDAPTWRAVPCPSCGCEESLAVDSSMPDLGARRPFEVLTGLTPKADRLPILERFRRGETQVLVSRAKMLGYGLNFQNCGSMVFSGFSDSYEQFYQAIRRAVRSGQLKNVRVHLPAVTGLETDMLENLFRKEAAHEAAANEMELNYVKAGALLRTRGVTREVAC